VAALLHPDWSEIGQSGRLWSRAETLEEIGPVPATRVEVISSERVADDAILLLWRAVSRDRSSLRSTLWVRVGGRWQARFHQGTTEP
jgi:ribonuclease HI